MYMYFIISKNCVTYAMTKMLFMRKTFVINK